jgi:hypothetical protein
MPQQSKPSKPTNNVEQPRVLALLVEIAKVGPTIADALEREGTKIDRQKIIRQIEPSVEKVQQALSHMQFFNNLLIAHLKKTPYDRIAVQVDLEDMENNLQSMGEDISSIRQVMQAKLSNDDLIQAERMAESALLTKGIEINEMLERLGLLRPGPSGSEPGHLDLVAGANDLNRLLTQAQNSFAQLHSKLANLNK